MVGKQPAVYYTELAKGTARGSAHVSVGGQRGLTFRADSFLEPGGRRAPSVTSSTESCEPAWPVCVAGKAGLKLDGGCGPIQLRVPGARPGR